MKVTSEAVPQAPPRRNFLPAILVVLVLAGLFAYWKWSHPADEKVEFETEKTRRGDVTAVVSATGTLESDTTVTVGSQVSGPVQAVPVDFNTRVRQGDVLARIDPSEFEARLGQARAGLDSAQAGLQNARGSLANADAAIAQARAQIAQSEANIAEAKSNVDSAEAAVRNAGAGVRRARAEMENALLGFQRFEKLYKRELVAASELDQARTTYRVQSAAYETALAAKDQAVANHRQSLARLEASRSEEVASQTRLEAAQAQRQSATAQVASAQAQVSQAQASLEQAAVDVERTTIRTPIDGVVIERKVDVGQTVAAAFQAPELFVIAGDLTNMQVRADVSEADIGRVDEGQKVNFTVDAYPDREFSGKVIQVRAAPATKNESSSGTASNVVVYGVLVSAPNQDLLLKPGMTATVAIQAETEKDALLVPNEALRFIPPNPPEREEKSDKKDRKKSKVKGRHGTVWVEGAEGPERRDLVLGITDEEMTVVKDGELKAGTEVLVGLKEDKKKKRGRGFRVRF
ncbi:MAG: HlyD family secretion protein [Candidatus Eremiobacteraeota bacterium]|nr:HlyD family secretion protein [Candidatus Eremiobacteraeota bacterium]